MKKKVLALLLALCMAASLVSCGPQGSEGDTDGEDTGEIKETLVVGFSATMTSFDTINIQKAADMYGPALSHMTLVEIDVNTKEVVGYLATHYEYSEERGAYIFELNENAVFSTGDPVTADDVVFTMESLLASPIGHGLVSCVTNCYAEGDHTVVAEVTNPSLEFLYNLAMSNCVIISRKACEDDPENGMKIGCGPYTIAEYVPDDYTLYQRVEDYWNGTAPSKYIRYQKIAEASGRAIALQTSEIDIDLALSPSEVATVENDENCVVYNKPGTTVHYIFFNMAGTNEAIKDQRVRQAIAYAINADDLIVGAYEGYAEKTTYLPKAAIDASGYDCNMLDYDLEKAKTLMAEAGYADGFDLTVHFNSLLHDSVEEILQNQLSKIGINLTIACADSTQMNSDFASRQGYEMGMTTMQFSNTPGRLASAIWKTGAFVNYSNGGTPVADEALVKVVNANTVEERQEYAYEYNQAMAEDCVFIPLFTSNALTGVRKNVQGLGVCDGSLYVVLRDAYVVD